MMRKALFSFLIMLVCVSCQTVSNYSLEKVDYIKYENLDSILSLKGDDISEVMGSKDYIFFYLSTNECAECLSNLIDFSQVVNTTNTDSIPVVLWVTGADSTQMEYYMSQETMEIIDNIFLYSDPEDTFHEKTECHYTNDLFIVWKSKRIDIMKSSDPVYKWNIESLNLLIQQ